MEFCPACGMLLQIQPATGGHRLRLFCPTCPYVCPVKHKIVKKARLVKKVDNSGSGGAMPRMKANNVSCPTCHHGEVTYEQKQTRSADEPMTIIYECSSCKHTWREE